MLPTALIVLQNIIVPSEHAKVSVEVKFHSVIIADTLEGLGHDCWGGCLVRDPLTTRMDALGLFGGRGERG